MPIKVTNPLVEALYNLKVFRNYITNVKNSHTVVKNVE